MPSLSRRVALAAPPAPSAAVLGKRAATDADADCPPDKRAAVAAIEHGGAPVLLSPPSLVKVRLVAVPGVVGASATSGCTVCAVGCLRGTTHVGMCHTAEGPAPPSIHAAHKAHKAWENAPPPKDAEAQTPVPGGTA